jgi:hypothetical protein
VLPSQGQVAALAGLGQRMWTWEQMGLGVWNVVPFRDSDFRFDSDFNPKSRSLWPSCQLLSLRNPNSNPNPNPLAIRFLAFFRAFLSLSLSLLFHPLSSFNTARRYCSAKPLVPTSTSRQPRNYLLPTNALCYALPQRI